mmetsp:Transcript_22184/g.48511  ORF Transcript_22184/g.48511 Transcript_22184/m.48511 type:complete len:326 (-) Transcript_22184:171-1148(-)
MLTSNDDGLDLLAEKVIDHGHDGSRLESGLVGVVAIGVAPPVPAALGVAHHAARGLGVEDDQIVSVGPGVDASVLDVLGADVVQGLLAAMKCDVKAARARRCSSLRGATAGDVQVACGGHSNSSVGSTGEEGSLIELDQLTSALDALDLGHAVKVLHHGRRTIEVAIVDVGGALVTALAPEVFGGEGVLTGDVVVGLNGAQSSDEVLVVLFQLLYDLRIDDRVLVAAEDPNLVVLHILGGIDVAVLLGSARGSDQGVNVEHHRRAHASDQGRGHLALSTIPRAPSEDASASNPGTVGNMKLDGHEAARREARDGQVRPIDGLKGG